MSGIATEMTAPRASAASGAARMRAARRSKIRSFVTPEGIDLSLEIASAGLRFGALVIDFTLMILILVGASLLMAYGLSGIAGGDAALIVWLLGFFVLRNFWFIGFELGPRAATPGKRLAGIRVVARDGGRLTVSAVVARNLVREVEMFLPMAFLAGGAAQDMVDAATAVAGLLWSMGMSFFLLLNRDRMRLGDLIGGTWVVVARRGKIATDLSATMADQPGAPVFTAEELAVYGVYELQELERVLREGDARLLTTVADTIRAKIGREIREDDRVFLSAYYRQLKAGMERDLLFGKRRANKYEAKA
jgi:uncharacterized RDD family membrane protein YckC